MSDRKTTTSTKRVKSTTEVAHIKRAQQEVKALLDTKGISAYFVADEMGVTSSYVYQTLNENNASKTSWGSLETIANVAGHTLFAEHLRPLRKTTGRGRLDLGEEDD